METDFQIPFHAVRHTGRISNRHKLCNFNALNRMKEMKPMKEVLYLVVHCSCTRVSQRVTVDDIDRWHRAKNWAMCGYHWVIYQDGSIHQGRPEKYAGSHVRHYNQHAIGICYIGGMDDKGYYADTRTPEQKAALYFLLKDLKEAYPQAKIVGHRDFPNVAKSCPNFDCQKEYAELNGMSK